MCTDTLQEGSGEKRKDDKMVIIIRKLKPQQYEIFFQQLDRRVQQVPLEASYNVGMKLDKTNAQKRRVAILEIWHGIGGSTVEFCVK